jgi:glutamate---cysteine ligase / carboxylate-amine ligase
MSTLPEWAAWHDGDAYTLGVEEEVMLLDPSDWSLAQQADKVTSAVHPHVQDHVGSETQRSVVELQTGPHPTAGEVRDELIILRQLLESELAELGLRAASAGTHPSTVWQETVVSSGERYREVYGSMRELARREPTFALHVHVAIPDREHAIGVFNRMRGHLPMLLALSANSPFWQGRDTGLASARTPLWQAFPRVGIPRTFRDYEDWCGTVDLLVRSDAFPDASFLWWDVRPQPRYGTIEVRICDAQTRLEESVAIAALVQSIARLEIEEGYVDGRLAAASEVLDENRFIAARDGMNGELLDLARECRRPARDLLAELIEACRTHAQDLGCEAELDAVSELAEHMGSARQLELARGPKRLPGLVEALADEFTSSAAQAPSSRASRAA